jgi:hypothetical protein
VGEVSAGATAVTTATATDMRGWGGRRVNDYTTQSVLACVPCMQYSIATGMYVPVASLALVHLHSKLRGMQRSITLDRKPASFTTMATAHYSLRTVYTAIKASACTNGFDNVHTSI